MATTEIILIGGGGHARVVADCVLAQGFQIKGFFDNSANGYVLDFPCLGDYEAGLHQDLPVIISIGDNAARKRLSSQEVKHNYVQAIHPSVLLSKFANVGEGSMLLHGAIIQAKTSIGSHVIINTGSHIDHDCVIEDFVHIAPGTVICGHISVGEGTLIGAGAIVIPGVKIGKWCVVGAGSVVIGDVPDYATVVGNPARIVKYNQP